MRNFLEEYNYLITKFKKKNCFQCLTGNKQEFTWPKGSGVYVIWKGTPDEKENNNLIYVGLTGKFKRKNDNRIELNNSVFSSRKYRWTPYRFFESKNDDEKNKFYFRYGPIHSSVSKQEKVKNDPNAYQFEIEYENLHIDCFIIQQSDEFYTSTLIEAILLTKFLKETSNLPPANNEL